MTGHKLFSRFQLVPQIGNGQGFTLQGFLPALMDQPLCVAETFVRGIDSYALQKQADHFKQHGQILFWRFLNFLFDFFPYKGSGKQPSSYSCLGYRCYLKSIACFQVRLTGCPMEKSNYR